MANAISFYLSLQPIKIFDFSCWAAIIIFMTNYNYNKVSVEEQFYYMDLEEAYEEAREEMESDEEAMEHVALSYRND